MTRREHPPNRILELRTERGMSGRDLARAIGCDPGQLSKLERSLGPLTLSWINVISKALNCHPWELMPEWKSFVMADYIAAYRAATDEHPAASADRFEGVVMRPASVDDQGRFRQVEIRDDGSFVTTVVYYRPRPDDPQPAKKDK